MKKNLVILTVVVCLLGINIYTLHQKNQLTESLNAFMLRADVAPETSQSLELAKGYLGALIDDINLLRESEVFPVVNADTDDEKVLLLKLKDHVETDLGELVVSIGPLRPENDGTYFVECLTFKDMNQEAIEDLLKTSIPTNFLRAHSIKVTGQEDTLIYEIVE